MEDIIKVSQLSKKYVENEVVKNLTLNVKRGEILGLLGANGAGKSTSIECILGTRKADTGTVSILGMSPKKDRKTIFENVGVQFQEANYQNEIRVNELCEETMALYKQPADYLELLKKFGIDQYLKSPVKSLSGGQRQRLFIILALIPNPEIVFLDELTTGLDTRARREVWKTLEILKQNGLTIVLTSHFMDEVETLCDRVCILKKGETVFLGTVKEAIQNSPFESFEDAYLWYAYEEEEDENI